MSGASIEKQLSYISPDVKSNDTAQLDNSEKPKKVFGIDRNGKTVANNDTVKLLTRPHTGKRGVAIGMGNGFGECIVEWWDGTSGKFIKQVFKTDDVEKYV